MKIIMTISAMLLLIAGNIWAGSEYDRCVKEEKNLKKQEAADCGGLAYLLNPSACFATQKALKKYTSTGKCKNIGLAENVDFSVTPVITAKAGKTVTNKSEPETRQQESACQQLKEENTRIKTEIEILKTENEQFRKAKSNQPTGSE